MKSISRKDINIGVTLVILFVVTLIAGFIKLPLFVFAATFLFSYTALDIKKLRCPNCGGFENLDRLMYAQNHIYHCRHCGEKINIS